MVNVTFIVLPPRHFFIIHVRKLHFDMSKHSLVDFSLNHLKKNFKLNTFTCNETNYTGGAPGRVRLAISQYFGRPTTHGRIRCGSRVVAEKTTPSQTVTMRRDQQSVVTMSSRVAEERTAFTQTVKTSALVIEYIGGMITGKSVSPWPRSPCTME